MCKWSSSQGDSLVQSVSSLVPDAVGPLYGLVQGYGRPSLSASFGG